ncbi:MAG: hypothetical protein SFT94_07680 [Pseudanabaenaceae cyanobacterium bins.68]|nr:hypothetical protein [Pseudanabaenaceae cyanobacterium bins.68]
MANHQLSKPWQKLHQYACTVPVFGLIPSVIALASRQQNPQLKHTAKISLGLMLVWAGIYLNLGTGVRQELYQGSLTSIYFLASVGLMLRIYLKSMRALKK